MIANVDRPIVLVDEVLRGSAIGPSNRSCFIRVEQMFGQGKTVLLVSHSAVQVERFCKRGIYLRDGQLIGDGPVGRGAPRAATPRTPIGWPSNDQSAVSARRAASCSAQRRLLVEAEDSEDVVASAPCAARLGERLGRLR